MEEPGFTKLADARVAIVGLGLMGGSLALALRGHCREVVGVDINAATLDLARQNGVVDRVVDLDGCAGADLHRPGGPRARDCCSSGQRAGPPGGGRRPSCWIWVLPSLRSRPPCGRCRPATTRSAAIPCAARKWPGLRTPTLGYSGQGVCPQPAGVHQPARAAPGAELAGAVGARPVDTAGRPPRPAGGSQQPSAVCRCRGAGARGRGPGRRPGVGAGCLRLPRHLAPGGQRRHHDGRHPPDQSRGHSRRARTAASRS